MAGLNRVIICGRLGKDPDLRKVGDKAVVTLSVATSEKIKDKEYTEWHSISVWGKMAEICATQLSKGDQVCVEGKLQTKSWEKDGKTHYKTEILSQNIQFISSKKSEPKSEKPSDDEVPW